MQTEDWGHAIYHAYASQIAGAKALLVREGAGSNTYADIMASFDEVFVATGAFELPAGSFIAQVLSYLGGKQQRNLRPRLHRNGFLVFERP